MALLHKLYKFNAIPINMAFFTVIEQKKNLQISMESQIALNNQSNTEEKKQS